MKSSAKEIFDIRNSGVFKTLANIIDGAFFGKIVNGSNTDSRYSMRL